MRKLILIPIVLTATTPLISMVGCGEPQETEYDLTIISSDNITVEPTKFKINHELVIHYSCDNGYVIDEEGSKITINDKVYSVSQLPHDRSTVTLSKDKVNYETITVNFLAKEQAIINYDLTVNIEYCGCEALTTTETIEFFVGKQYSFTINMSDFDSFTYRSMLMFEMHSWGALTSFSSINKVVIGDDEIPYSEVAIETPYWHFAFSRSTGDSVYIRNIIPESDSIIYIELTALQNISFSGERDGAFFYSPS